MDITSMNTRKRRRKREKPMYGFRIQSYAEKSFYVEIWYNYDPSTLYYLTKRDGLIRAGTCNSTNIKKILFDSMTEAEKAYDDWLADQINRSNNTFELTDEEILLVL